MMADDKFKKIPKFRKSYYKVHKFLKGEVQIFDADFITFATMPFAFPSLNGVKNRFQIFLDVLPPN
jgi:hypothetical protein